MTGGAGNSKVAGDIAGVQDVVMCAGEGRGAGAVMSQAQGEDHNFGCKQGSSLNCSEFLSQMPDSFKIVALQWKDIEF